MSHLVKNIENVDFKGYTEDQQIEIGRRRINLIDEQQKRDRFREMIKKVTLGN